MLINNFLLHIKFIFKRCDQLLLLILIPVLVLTSYNIADKRIPESRIPIAIIDNDNTEISKLILERLKSDPVINVIDLGEKSIEDAILSMEICAGYVMNKGFSDKILAGTNRNLISLINGKDNTKANVSSEIVIKELLRISTSVLGSEFIQSEYEKRNVEFTESLKQEILQNTESYWGKHKIDVVNIKYVGEHENFSSDVFNKLIIIKIFMSIIISYLFFMSCQKIAQEKEQDFFKQFKILGHYETKLITVEVAAKICFISIIFIILFLILKPESLQGLCLNIFMFISVGILNILILSAVKSRYMYSNIILLFSILLPAIAGASHFFGLSSLRIIWYINPYYSFIEGNILAQFINISLMITAIIAISKRLKIK